MFCTLPYPAQQWCVVIKTCFSTDSEVVPQIMILSFQYLNKQTTDPDIIPQILKLFHRSWFFLFSTWTNRQLRWGRWTTADWGSMNRFCHIRPKKNFIDQSVINSSYSAGDLYCGNGEGKQQVKRCGHFDFDFFHFHFCFLFLLSNNTTSIPSDS